MRIKHDSKYWKPEYSNTKKLALQYGQEVSFKVLPPGIFVYKGMTSHLELVEKYLDDEIEKGLEMSKLNISLALEEALKSVEGGNKSHIGNLFSDDDECEAIPEKKRKESDGNYHSSPEENQATPRISGSSDVNKFKKTCCQCHQTIEKNRQVINLITATVDDTFHFLFYNGLFPRDIFYLRKSLGIT